MRMTAGRLPTPEQRDQDASGWEGRRAGRFVGLVLVLTLPALASIGIAGPHDLGVELPDNPLEGRRLFESKRCNQCHGISGAGSGIAPNLGEGRFAGTFLDLGAALWNHVPGMSISVESAGLDWPELDEKEVVDLIVFLSFIDYLGRPGDPAAGRSVFESEGCHSCHVMGGGKARVGPDLAGLRRFASPLYVAQEIWNHGPSMLASMDTMNVLPPSFDDGDLADLSAFIRQQVGPGPHEPQLSTPGSPKRGRKVFEARGCTSCHGSDARGGRGGPDLSRLDLRRSAADIAGTMWNHALAMRDAMRARNIGWPRFVDSELADLTAFLYFLSFDDPPGSPERGTTVFASRGCAGCHPTRSGEVARGEFQGPELAPASAPALVAAMWDHAPIMKEAILRQGLPWPELTGDGLRNLHAYLQERAGSR
jgi:cytochrome c2